MATRKRKKKPVVIVIEVNAGGIIENVWCSVPARVRKMYTDPDDVNNPADPWPMSNRKARAYVKRHKLIEVA